MRIFLFCIFISLSGLESLTIIFTGKGNLGGRRGEEENRILKLIFINWSVAYLSLPLTFSCRVCKVKQKEVSGWLCGRSSESRSLFVTASSKNCFIC